MTIDHNRTEDRRYVWNYFQMHASQRLTTFHFYILLSTLIATGLFAVFRGDFQYAYVGIILGLFLVLFSYIFWKLDMRNQTLIKNAEQALKHLENRYGTNPEEDEPQPLQIFRREEYITTLLQKENSIWPWKRYYTYSKCFMVIFATFAIIGMIGIILSTILVLANK